MRGHTALTRNKVARGSTLVHAQQHSLYVYIYGGESKLPPSVLFLFLVPRADGPSSGTGQSFFSGSDRGRHVPEHRGNCGALPDYCGATLPDSYSPRAAPCVTSFSYNGQMNRRTALDRAFVAARIVPVTFQITVETAGPGPIMAGQRCPIRTPLAQRPVLALARTTGRSTVERHWWQLSQRLASCPSRARALWKLRGLARF